MTDNTEFPIQLTKFFTNMFHFLFSVSTQEPFSPTVTFELSCWKNLWFDFLEVVPFKFAITNKTITISLDTSLFVRY